MVHQPATLEQAKQLGLLEEEFHKICDILGRQPNFTEISIYSVMWSEHCSYKNSIVWLKTLPKSGSKMLAEAGEENAGLVDIGDGLACCFKIESHNHPSAIEPYQGAATGVGGINRDIFSMGARPIAQLNSLRFGNINTPRTQWLVKGVVKGIGDYGNAFGIPTEPVSALLVGGGYGSAPLFGLAEVLKNRGCRVIMALGASSAAKIYAPIEGKRAATLLKIFTEDGSAGEIGRVTDSLFEMIKEHDIRVIYSCGPMPMLQAVSEIAASADIAHQAAVEESMACGVGICMTCIIPAKDGKGEIKNLRSCIDGPVMDGEVVQWHLVGKQL